MQWNRQPREGVEYPSLQILKSRVDVLLFHELWDDPASAGSDRCGPFQRDRSVILCL